MEMDLSSGREGMWKSNRAPGRVSLPAHFSLEMLMEIASALLQQERNCQKRKLMRESLAFVLCASSEKGRGFTGVC